MHCQMCSKASSDKCGDSVWIQKTLDDMHVEAKGKAVMGSSKKFLQISRKNDITKEATEVEKSKSTDSSR